MTMRTPEEIKKGLECCKNGECEDCRYLDGSGSWSCIGRLIKDVFAYIQQLEQRLVEANKTSMHWISVGERLPENGQKIIAAFRGSSGWVVDQARYAYGEFDFASWVNVLGDNVTHWMPLPLPPEE